MAKVFRQQYTRAIPEGAERVQAKVRRRGREAEVDAVRFKGPDGKWVIAPLTAKGDRCRVTSPTYSGWVAGRQVRLCENKAASEVMLAQLIGKAALAGVGIANPFEAEEARLLAEHLADYRRELEARDNALGYVATVVGQVDALLSGCGFVFPADLDPGRATAWLADLRRVGQPLPPLPEGRGEFTLAELARAIGVKPASVAPLVRRHGLAAAGEGRAAASPAPPPRHSSGCAGAASASGRPTPTCPSRRASAAGWSAAVRSRPTPSPMSKRATPASTAGTPAAS